MIYVYWPQKYIFIRIADISRTVNEYNIESCFVLSSKGNRIPASAHNLNPKVFANKQLSTYS